MVGLEAEVGLRRVGGLVLIGRGGNSLSRLGFDIGYKYNPCILDVVKRLKCGFMGGKFRCWYIPTF